MEEYSLIISALFIVACYFLYWCSKADSEKAEIIKELKEEAKIQSPKANALFRKATLNKPTDSARFVAVPVEERRGIMVGLKVTLQEKLVLERLSKLHGKSISNVIREALQEYVQGHDTGDLYVGEIDKDQLSI